MDAKLIVAICLQVFFCRIVDVSLGTIRTIMTVKGKPSFAAMFGFAEVFIWFLAVRSALSSGASGVILALSYASGFAIGTYIGGILARKFIRSILDVQVITSSQNQELVNTLREEGFGVTVLNVNSSEYADEKFMLVIEIKNERLDTLRHLVRESDPGAFIMVRETKLIHNGFFK